MPLSRPALTVAYALFNNEIRCALAKKKVVFLGGLGARPVRESLPTTALARAMLLAALGVAAAAWALERHYAAIRPPMLVPSSAAPRGSPTYDVDAGEMPVPDTFWDSP